MRILIKSLIGLLCVLPLTVTGCGTRSQSEEQPILTEGVVDESLPKETKEAQQWLKKLLNAAKEGSISPEALKFIAPGIKIEESVDTFLEGHKWLARWEFGSGANKGRVPVVLYFTDLEFHWGDPEKHLRVERVYDVKKNGSGVTIKRGS
jgi:hypothetical protein